MKRFALLGFGVLLGAGAVVALVFLPMPRRAVAPAKDWLNPDNAPPSMLAHPHDFVAAEGSTCCARCGGGRLDSVHAGVFADKLRTGGGMLAPVPASPGGMSLVQGEAISEDEALRLCGLGSSERPC